MKSISRRRTWALAALWGSVWLVLAQESPQEWVQHLRAGALQAVFFRPMAMPWGASPGRRPPAETRVALAGFVKAQPGNAELYRLRAHEDELAQDFAAAQADWTEYARRSRDYLSLADYYSRRADTTAELTALAEVARTAKDDPDTALAAQVAWTALAREVDRATEQALAPRVTVGIYHEWIKRYSQAVEPWEALVAFLTQKKMPDEAEAEIAAYAAAFPDRRLEVTRFKAQLAESEQGLLAARRVYESAGLQDTDEYLDLLQRMGGLREYISQRKQARAAHAADPGPVSELFHYYLHEKNNAEARRVLLDFHAAESADYALLATSFAAINEPDESARNWYALYRAPSADAGQRQAALVGLLRLLLEHPEQPIAFGAGNVSLYRDIGTMDRGPGFLNGILSLLLNGQGPKSRYQELNQAAGAYFHREAAAELLPVLAREFPHAAERSELEAKLIDAYAQYGDAAAVISRGRVFLTAFPKAAERTSVALAIGQALAQTKQTAAEFALYDQMLVELARQAGGVPIGRAGITNDSSAAVPATMPERTTDVDNPDSTDATPEPVPVAANHSAPSSTTPRAHSPQYVLVLDRYLGRLAASKRVLEAVALYRRELDRHPRDPGLYARLAAFLDEHRMTQPIAAVYQRAAQQFPDRSWYQKLARFYLREKKQAQLLALSKTVAGLFTGSELDAYVTALNRPEQLDADLYRQVNLFAHERFPNDLRFLHNLLTSYRATNVKTDSAAADALVRQYWALDPQIETEYLQTLSQSGQLATMLATARAGVASPLASRFIADAEAWRSHYEEAAPSLEQLAAAAPGDVAANTRAMSVERSLGKPELAERYQANVIRSQPRDREELATAGDIYGERDLLAEARPFWERMVQTAPGVPESYLDAATVYWDYFQFADARRLIEQGRARLGQPALYAYQLGAIREGERDTRGAIEEYLVGAASGDEPSSRRIVRLANRPAVRTMVDERTARAAASADAASALVRLRIDVMKAQGQPIAPLLQAKLAQAQDSDTLSFLQQQAQENGESGLVAEALQRRAQLTRDPVERRQIQWELVSHYEAVKDAARARQTAEAAYRESPLILGVVRAAADFYERQNDGADAARVLLAASGRAYPALSREWRLEAARQSTPAEARRIVSPILAADPLNVDALAIEADSYARAGDAAGLAQSITATLARVQQAPLPADAKQARTLALRRALLPALTRQGAFTEAVDQYIELMKASPEDGALVAEAARFAQQHQLIDRLRGYFVKAVDDSPRDYRWPLVLARIEERREYYPAAVAAYTKALGVRPDRRDFLEARVKLQVRLARFEEAAASDLQLYELSYHDGAWLQQAAEMRARQGRHADAVTLLEKGIVNNQTATADEMFAIAQVLDGWHLVDEAARYLARGQQMGGSSDALAVRLLAERRRLPELVALVKRVPPQAVTAGPVIAALYTPEEKAALAGLLRAAAAPVDDKLLGEAWLPLAHAGQLADLEAEWRFIWAQRHPDAGSVTQLVEWQRGRGQFAELAQQLEKIVPLVPPQDGSNPAFAALAQAYRAAENPTAELAVYERGGHFLPTGGEPMKRYVKLMRARAPQVLAQRVAMDNGYGELVLNAALAQITDGAESAALIRAREAQEKAPFWGPAHLALAGLFYGGPEVRPQFQQVLGSQTTIGARLQAKTDGLVGEPWFYYGQRFGEYLAYRGQADSLGYLESELEREPAVAEAYARLARFARGQKRWADAIDADQRALQLEPNRGQSWDGVALAHWSAGRKQEAYAAWREAFTAYRRVQDAGGRVPEWYWPAVAETLQHLGEVKQVGPLEDRIADLLIDYTNHNQQYRADELITATVAASRASNTGSGWLIQLAMRSEIAMPLGRLIDEQTSAAERVTIQRAIVTLAARHPEQKERLLNARLQLVEYLLAAGDTAQAEREWQGLKPDLPTSTSLPEAAVRAQIALAVAGGRLPALLADYGDSEYAPEDRILQMVATRYREGDHAAAGLALREYLYSRAIRQERGTEADFLGLAQVRLEQKRTAEAVALLRRMVLITGEPFAGLATAGELLASFEQTEQARAFFADRARAVPWDTSARLRLAELSGGGAGLVAVVDDRLAPYAERLDAAKAGAAPTKPGDEELLALAQQQPQRVAGRPYTIAARMGLQQWSGALLYAPESADLHAEAARAALAQGKEETAMALLQGDRPIVASYWTQADRDAATQRYVLALERRGEYEQALKFARVPKGSAAQQNEVLVQRLQHEAEVAAENEAHRPLMGAGLETQRVVAPRRPL